MRYLKQYKMSNIIAMMRNNRKEPETCNDDFEGRLVIISGATSGIGYETAREYASHGANLLLINRNEEKSIAVCEEIREGFRVECDYKIANYARLSDVRRIGKELLESDIEIDVLIHNAGVYSTKKVITEDNNELSFQVNYLASFILNYMLKDKLKAGGKTRIILVSSEGHRFAVRGIRLDDLNYENHRHTGLGSYGVAKTAQLLSVIKFVEYFEDSGVTINAVHPGDVKSNMGLNNGRIYRFFKNKIINRTLKSPERSAKALYYLGVSKEVGGISGKFFNLTTEEEPAPPALDRDVAEELWKATIELVGLE
ncbi:MAG: SDR family NAD(P)-dependent oxidoreductase [Candidatus Thorarchaeota archaeon]|nr:MAG: SDR family NAD(P)-dependent oxidoreductase [Candidatus Thorarchaeota archaeon]